MTNNTIQAHSDLLTAVDTVNTSIQQLNDIQHEVNSTVGVSNTQLSQLNEAETNVLTATAASQTAQALLDTNIHIQTETANALNTLSEVAEEQDVDAVIEEIIEEVDDVVEDANAQQEEVVEEIEEFFSMR
jgi:ABC-type transporter Mla subunit MlaD